MHHHRGRVLTINELARQKLHRQRPATAKIAEPRTRRITADDLPCVHRGKQVATVPCGLCGGRDRQVAVYACARRLFATIGAVARTDRQRLDGVLPVPCIGCGDRSS